MRAASFVFDDGEAILCISACNQPSDMPDDTWSEILDGLEQLLVSKYNDDVQRLDRQDAPTKLEL